MASLLISLYYIKESVRTARRINTVSIRETSQLMLYREIIASCLKIIWNKQIDLFVFRYPMEMHIVHRKQSYGSVQEALNHPDGLSVLAFFFQVSTFLSLAKSLICSHCARLSRQWVWRLGVTPCSLENAYWRFGRAFKFRVEDRLLWQHKASGLFEKWLQKLRLQSVTSRKT
jgi:hypothetical protein